MINKCPILLYAYRVHRSRFLIRPLGPSHMHIKEKCKIGTKFNESINRSITVGYCRNSCITPTLILQTFYSYHHSVIKLNMLFYYMHCAFWRNTHVRVGDLFALILVN